MSTKPLVLIIGPTGNTAASIVDALLESGEYRVSGLVRSLSDRPEYEKLKERGVNLHGIDWISGSSPELVEALTGVDIVISCCNWQTLEQQKNVIDAAKQAGTVKRFIPCDWGTICPPGVMKLEDVKRTIHAYLEQSSIPYTVCDVGFWYQITFPAPPKQFTPLTAPDFLAKMYELYGTGNVPSLVINREHIGRFVLKIIGDERTINRKVLMYEDEVTLNRVWELAEKYAGGEVAGYRKNFTTEELEKHIEENQDQPWELLWFHYVKSMYVNGDNTLENAKKTGWLVANELYPEIPVQNADEFAKEYYA